MPLTEIHHWLGQTLPSTYAEFLAQCQVEEAVGDYVLLYGQEIVVERNETYETKEYCPGWLAIGNDSGGSQIILSLEDGKLRLVDSGSMDPAHGSALSPDFVSWYKQGCPLP